MSSINQIQLPNGSIYDFEDTAAREAASSKADKTTATSSADGLMSAADKKAVDREFFRMLPKGGIYIPANADLNSIEYLKVGTYYNSSVGESGTIKNTPTGSAFIMYVLSLLSEVYDNESTDQWVYRLRIFITYTGDGIFVQRVSSGDIAGSFDYGPWIKQTNSDDLSAVIPTKTSDLTNDSDFMSGMTILAYGKSTWADFIAAYTARHVVYCRASSGSNPASGSQTRMAFMAYVNNETNPTNVEFQYYRSVKSRSATQQGDQVYVYTLDKTAGWTVTVRECYTRIVAETGITATYSNGVLTIADAVSNTINDHIANKSNPHGVTKAQVGLGSVANLDQSKAIKSITRSGTTFTATALDGTTTTFTQQDSSTTYSVATSSADGLMSAADKSKLDGIGAGSNVKSVNGKTGAVSLSKADVGLGNVDNTKDADKPISTAVQTALDAKANNSVATESTDGLMSAADKAKLDGVADQVDALAEKNNGLYFDTNSDGKWGYKTSSTGTLIPFRNPTGNAAAADVLSGKTFSSASQENEVGTMPYRGQYQYTKTMGVGSGYYALRGIPEGCYRAEGQRWAPEIRIAVEDAKASQMWNDAYTDGYEAGYKEGYTAGEETAAAGGGGFD